MSATSARTSRRPSLSPAPGHVRAIAPEDDDVDTSVGQVCDQRQEVAPTISVQPQDTAVPSLLRWTVWTPPAVACVDQRRKVAPTMLSPAPCHGSAIAPEEDGVDTSGGNLRRSGLRAAPGGHTHHLSVPLQATAAQSLLRKTVWTPLAAACVGQVCGRRQEVAPTMLQPAAGSGCSIAPEENCVDTSGGSLRRSGLRPAPRDCTDHLSVQLQATAVPWLLGSTAWTPPAAACVDQVSD